MAKKSTSLSFKSLAIYFSIVIAILAAGIYYATNSQATEALISISSFRHSTNTIAGSKGIETYLEQLSRSLSSLGKDKDIISMNLQSHDHLKNFSDDWANSAVTGVMLINKQGFGIYNYVAGKGENSSVDVSDRDYFVWAKTAKTGEHFFGAPIIPRENMTDGERIVPIATPLIENGKFNGALVTGITVSELNKKFIEPLKYPDKTRVYIVDGTGTFLSGYDERYVGQNFIDYHRKNPFLGSEMFIENLEKIVSGCEAGVMDIALPNDETGKFDRFLLSSAPMMCDTDHKWTIFIGTPVDSVLKLLAPIYINQLGVFLAALFIVLLLTLAFVKFGKNNGKKTKTSRKRK